MAPRVWCWTPNPVLEIKFLQGRRIVSAGGKGHNVARQLRFWGMSAVSLVPGVGPAWVRAARTERICIREIPVRTPARTGWACVAGPGHRLDFFTEDSRWNLSDWDRCAHFLRRKARPGDWWVVAGSVPEGAPPGGWRSLFLGLKKRGVRILVDGQGRLLREALQAGVAWAKANVAEAEEAVKRKGAPRCLARMRILSRGRSGLLITRGPGGLIFQAGKTKGAIPAPRIRLRDATGSGDVVTAALIHGIQKAWSLNATARFAARMASGNAAMDEVGRVPFRS